MPAIFLSRRTCFTRSAIERSIRHASQEMVSPRCAQDWCRGVRPGAIFVGEDAKLEINRNKISSSNKDLLKSPDNPGPITKPETQYHIENWVECIKSRQRANADIEYGLRSTTLCYLVNIVREVGLVGKKLRWDPKIERFTNCDEANESWYISPHGARATSCPN